MHCDMQQYHSVKFDTNSDFDTHTLTSLILRMAMMITWTCALLLCLSVVTAAEVGCYFYNLHKSHGVG